MKIDDDLVVSNPGFHADTDDVPGSIALKAGVHRFTVYFGEGVGNARLRVKMNGQFIGASSVSQSCARGAGAGGGGGGGGRGA